jgi:hypothetical protein
MNLFAVLLALGIATTSPLEASKQPQNAQESTYYIFTSKESISDYIKARAIYHGYNPEQAVAIAKAESELVINAKNKTSTASGLFQFINGSFKYFCIEKYKMTDTIEDKNNPFIQIECATRLLSEGGEKHWNASKHVWQNALNE